ncbi:MAG: DUF2807 domain-containing protein [Anaerolineaceae bacterium]
MSDRTKTSYILGSLLIAVGVLFFLSEIFKINFTYLWPLFIIASGLVFFIAMFLAGKSTGFLAIPGSIITTIGLILLFQSLTNRWETWSYAWALIPFSVGVGMWIFGKFSDMDELRSAGRHVANVGLVLFIVFGLFFEVLIGISGADQTSNLLWPIALVVLGTYLLFSRLIWSSGSGSKSSSTVGIHAADVKKVVEPSDSAPSETRIFSGLTGLYHKGVGNVYLTQGDKDELRIEADPEIRSRIKTEVKDGILVIRHDNDFIEWMKIWTNGIEQLRFFLTIKDIRSIKLSGAGSLKAPAIHGDAFELVNSGAGSQTIENLDAHTFKVELSGAGSIVVAGKTMEQNVKLSGAGSYNAGRLESQKAVVKLSGVGSASVWVTGSLDANLSGIGSVEYRGEPQVSKHITGLGSIKALGK